MKQGKLKGVYGTMFYVENMKKAVDFYKTTLGFEDLNESPEWSEFNLKGQRLCFHVTQDATLVRKGGILIVQVEGLRAIMADLKKQGVEILSDVKEVHPGAFAAEFIDATGNIMSLYEGPQS